jgi:hypothetical protein
MPVSVRLNKCIRQVVEPFVGLESTDESQAGCIVLGVDLLTESVVQTARYFFRMKTVGIDCVLHIKNPVVIDALRPKL